MIDGIIFDLDGTLWDARAEIAKAWNKAVKEHSDCNVVIKADTFNSLFGLPNIQIMDALFPMLSPVQRVELERHCRTNQLDILKTEPGQLYEGVPALLEELSKNHPLFIVSNGLKGYIEAFLDVTGLEKYILGTLSYGDTMLPKGKNINQVIDSYQLKSPVYVGDMQGDCDAARYAGIPIIYAEYGLGMIEHPDASIQTPLDLLEIVNQGLHRKR